MNTTTFDALDAVRLRAEFDATFALPPVIRETAAVQLMLIRVTPDSTAALRVTQLGGLHKCPPLLRLPGAPATQLGIAGIRGKLVVVSSLAVALGHATATAGAWLAITAVDHSVGFAFDAIERQVQVPHAPAGTTAIRIDDHSYPLIDIAALVAHARPPADSSHSPMGRPT